MSLTRRILEAAASTFGKQDFLPLVYMPRLRIYRNLEDMMGERAQHSPRELVAVHIPELVPEGRRYCTISSSGMSNAMAELYNEKRNSSPQDTGQIIQSLDDSIQGTLSQRSQDMTVLANTAKGILERSNGRAQNSEEILGLIRSLTSSQFEYLEYFIREAIQNADGSSADKAANRIDVYLDRAARLIRIVDRGIGMTQKVMNDAFFNIYASLNEALSHAAGKFGIGAVSFFGLGHEYVKVDSNPVNGTGGMTIVDASLSRPEEYMPSERQEHGTTIEIKLSPESKVDFDKIIEILKGDCAYIETPLYLHQRDTPDSEERVEMLNLSLEPKPSASTQAVKEKDFQGYITAHEGSGSLVLLDHRIRLFTIPTYGYSGVINCDYFDTTFSRDTVKDDPVLRTILEYMSAKGKEIEMQNSIDIKEFSVEAQLRDYHRFVMNSLFNKDGSPNEEWIKENFRLLTFSSSGSPDMGRYLRQGFFSRAAETVINTYNNLLNGGFIPSNPKRRILRRIKEYAMTPFYDLENALVLAFGRASHLSGRVFGGSYFIDPDELSPNDRRNFDEMSAVFHTYFPQVKVYCTYGTRREGNMHKSYWLRNGKVSISPYRQNIDPRRVALDYALTIEHDPVKAEGILNDIRDPATQRRQG